MPAYQLIAKQFALPSAKMVYFGPVLFAADRIIAIPRRLQSNDPDSAALRGLGAIGSAIAATRGKPRDPLAKLMIPVPEAVRADPKARIRDDDEQAIVFLQRAVRDVRFPWWGRLTFEFDRKTIAVQVNFWRRGRVLKSMRDLGWKV